MRSGKTLIEILVILSIALILLLLIGSCSMSAIAALDHDAYTATVDRVETKRDGDSDRYLVFTTLDSGEVRVFSVEDSIIHWRWDSSDMYGEIKVGSTYEFDTYGWRVPFFSMYENVLELEVISTNEQEETESLEELSREELLERLRAQEGK